MAVPIIKTEQFENYKIKFKKTKIVIKFFATWCGPCQMLSPIFEEVANNTGDEMKFVAVDIDQSPELAQEFGVSSVPTIIVVDDGKEVNRNVGFIDADSLTNFLSK